MTLANSDWKIRSGKHGSTVIKILLAYGVTVMILLLIFVNGSEIDPNARAIIYMGTFALWLCWIGICGILMIKLRDPIKSKLGMKPERWKIKFVIFAIGLLLLEEIFTTLATNMVEIFGGEYGKAFITASDNYFEVILLHSAIVIWPGFVFWAWWLKKYDFHPNWVLILFGLSGLLSEISFGGIQQVNAIGMWMMTYGLMIYLPAYCIPADRGAVRPKLIHYLLPFILNVLFQLPMVFGVLLFRQAIGHTFPFVSD
jgi:hypothetical protein